MKTMDRILLTFKHDITVTIDAQDVKDLIAVQGTLEYAMQQSKDAEKRVTKIYNRYDDVILSFKNTTLMFIQVIYHYSEEALKDLVSQQVETRPEQSEPLSH